MALIVSVLRSLRGLIVSFIAGISSYASSPIGWAVVKRYCQTSESRGTGWRVAAQTRKRYGYSSPVPKKKLYAHSSEQNSCAYRLIAHFSQTGLKHSAHLWTRSTLDASLHFEQMIIAAQEYIKRYPSNRVM
jgi:hypothetical protein